VYSDIDSETLKILSKHNDGLRYDAIKYALPINVPPALMAACLQRFERIGLVYKWDSTYTITKAGLAELESYRKAARRLLDL
jgi:hypothetical protein